MTTTLSRQCLKQKGFQEFPHITVGNCLFYDLGRNRILSIGSVGTPNEMLFILQRNNTNDKIVDDAVCLHNYDYDGFLTEGKIESLLKFFT